MGFTFEFSGRGQQAYVDMFSSFIQEIARGRGIEIFSEFMKTDFYQKEKKDFDNLRDGQKKVQDAYQDFLETLYDDIPKSEIKLLDRDSTILYDLIEVIDKSKSEEEDSSLDLSTLFNDRRKDKEASLLTDKQAEKLNDFGNEYRQFKNTFLSHQDKVNSVNASLRGDKELYQIYFKEVSDTQGGQKTDKLIELSREDFESFEVSHPELFGLSLIDKRKKTNKDGTKETIKLEGTASSYTPKIGIEPQDVYSALITTQKNGKTIQTRDIMDDIYTVVNIDGKEKALSVRNVASVLFSEKLDNDPTVSHLYGKKQLGIGDRLEMLFNPTIQKGISEGLISGTIKDKQSLTEFFKTGRYGTEESATVDLMKIKEDIKSENLYGGAGGDLIFKREGNNTVFGVQQKAKAGKTPWNGLSVNALVKNEEFFFDLGKNIANLTGNKTKDNIPAQAEAIVKHLGLNSLDGNTTREKATDAMRKMLEGSIKVPDKVFKNFQDLVAQDVADWFLQPMPKNNEGNDMYEWIQDFEEMPNEVTIEMEPPF